MFIAQDSKEDVYFCQPETKNLKCDGIDERLFIQQANFHDNQK